MFKFIHAADIHLDSPRAGLDLDPDAPADEIRQAPRRSLENMVQFAIDEQVDFVLIAGDLYDGDWKDFHTGLFFVEQMARLAESGIPVYFIAGNHDAANRMTKTLKLPHGVHMFPDRQSGTIELNNLPVAIHGQSFARAAVFDDLSKNYPTRLPGRFNIGLLHTSATKSGEHECYAPCTIEGLRSKQYNYWALGHIHKREVLCEEPHIVFPGNLQGRHIRETGPKGCMLVTVDDHEHVSLDFQSTDVLRWERCEVDANEATDPYEIMERVLRRLQETADASDGRPLAVRVEIHGPTAAHHQLASDPKRWHAEIRSAAAQVNGGPVWIERVIRSTVLPIHLDQAALSEGPLRELAQYIQEVQEDEDALAVLAKEFQELQHRLPTELSEGQDAVLRFDTPETMRSLLDDAQHILTHRLVADRGAQ